MTSIATVVVGEPSGHMVVFSSLAILLVTLAIIVYLVANEQRYWIIYGAFAVFCLLLVGGMYAVGYYGVKVGDAEVGVAPHAPKEAIWAPKANVPPSVASIFEGPDI